VYKALLMVIFLRDKENENGSKGWFIVYMAHYNKVKKSLSDQYIW